MIESEQQTTTPLWRPVHAEWPDLPDPTRCDDLVVGAGLTGMITALLLAEAGRDVVLVEALDPGARAAGLNTGKVTLQHGQVLSRILRRSGSDELARAYVDANRAGMDWLLEFCERHGVPVQRLRACLYATTEQGAAEVATEADAARRAGLRPASDPVVPELPFPTTAGLTLNDQAQLAPDDLIEALVAAVGAAGVRTFRGRITDFGPGRIGTEDAAVECRTVVVATGMPATDHGFSFARLEATRSYLTSYLVDGPLPNGMYLAAEQPSRSLRVVRRDGAEQLLVGGNGHPVGRHPRPGELIDDLYRWTGRHFAGAALTHSWAAQDWQPYGPTPWLLAAERGDRRLYAVGGYAKWGLTNAPAAALRIRDAVCGHPTAGHDRILDRSRPQLRSLPSGLAGNLSVGRSAAQGWLRALGRPGTDRPGTVGLRHGRPVAVGEDCVLSAVCPHLGGIVRWNPAERSWDCPLHGSRFAPDGSVLDGPATHGLSRLEA